MQETKDLKHKLQVETEFKHKFVSLYNYERKRAGNGPVQGSPLK